ncbi:farnesyl-diphosphate synthase [Clostridia bacterium]|nr:farnesyl-diphosphate synthase [Clostridia bacterium]
MNFQKTLAEKAHEIDEKIKQSLFEAEEERKIDPMLDEAMQYSLFIGGKRLRPILMESVYAVYALPDQKIVPFLAAIECIHAFSLVHDDLPCMDNDSIRRGKSTLWKKYGEGMALLCGDALMVYAIEVILNQSEEIPPQTVKKALSVLVNKSGVWGMIGGQALDIRYTNSLVDEKALLEMYQKKSSALLEAAMLIGAILGQAKDEDLKIWENIARKIGLAFQIQDDVLDVIGKEEILGKDIGSDEKNQKQTFVALFGLDKAKQTVQRLSEEALQSLNQYFGKQEFLENLILYLLERQA